MSTNRKTISSKENWQALRTRYTWHLRPPFNDEFDHSHWWEHETQIDPVAALYELARRHPRVGQLWLKFKSASWYGHELPPHPLGGAVEKKILNQSIKDLGKEPHAIMCLCQIGLKSWPTLGWSNQEYWEMSAEKMKGLDCRDDSMRCNSITQQAESDILLKRARSLKLGKSAFLFEVGAGRNNKSVAPAHPQAFAKGMYLLAKHTQQNPITPAEMESAIARNAVAAHREGHLLISVAPDLTLNEAKILLEREYRNHLKLRPEVKQRARWQDWLPLISAFENEEAKPGGKKSQAFVKYRRAVDGIRFASRSG